MQPFPPLSCPFPFRLIVSPAPSLCPVQGRDGEVPGQREGPPGPGIPEGGVDGMGRAATTGETAEGTGGRPSSTVFGASDFGIPYLWPMRNCVAAIL